jgi:hypothetical protein
MRQLGQWEELSKALDAQDACEAAGGKEESRRQEASALSAPSAHPA